jgi:peroxiredoxin
VLPDLDRLGAHLVAVSPELPDNSLTTRERNELAFDVLSDVGNAVARSYGLVFRLDDELVPIYRDTWKIVLSERNGDDSWTLPIPGTFVIGPSGSIELAFVDADYTRRLEPEALLDAARRAARG